jgi:hypothetical protein
MQTRSQPALNIFIAKEKTVCMTFLAYSHHETVNISTTVSGEWGATTVWYCQPV